MIEERAVEQQEWCKHQISGEDHECLLIGIDIGGTKTAVTLGSAGGEIFEKRLFLTKPKYMDVLDDICEAVDEIKRSVFSEELKDSVVQVKDHALSISHIKALGISCGGPLDSVRGRIQSPPNLPDWDDVPIVRILERRLGLPCFLENDANACALAEWYWGNGRGAHNMIFLTFGTGMGAGLILQDRLYRGSNGLAGEVGHVRMASSGPLCYGKAGSWESFCSGTGISRLYEDKYGVLLTAKEICDKAEAGDEKALSVIAISSRYLGMGLSLLIDIINPDCIIIGSIYSRSEALFEPMVLEVIKQEALSLSAKQCNVMVSGLGELLGDMAALGVASDGLKRKRGLLHENE